MVGEIEKRARVGELFEKHRATPGAPYDEQHFLDFLLRSPKKVRAVYDSFRGLRRFNAFLDDIQMEFAICFSMEDRDANYSLDRFVDRVIELEGSRRGSLTSLKNQVKRGPGWHVLVFANLILLIVGAVLRASWEIVILIVLAVLMNVWLVRFVRSGSAYLARLQARIEDSP